MKFYGQSNCHQHYVLWKINFIISKEHRSLSMPASPVNALKKPTLFTNLMATVVQIVLGLGVCVG